MDRAWTRPAGWEGEASLASAEIQAQHTNDRMLEKMSNALTNAGK